MWIGIARQPAGKGDLRAASLTGVTNAVLAPLTGLSRSSRGLSRFQSKILLT